jgi:4-hydroxy-tetrahydrodipicolinate synthase
MFEGSYVALVTPFAGGKVDLNKLRELVEFQLESGTQGLVPVGTTGEAPTLSDKEKADVIRAVVKAARGRVPVVAGTGTYDTRASIALTKMARDLGADAALLVSPYYNKPTQEGLYRHYEAIAKAVNLPLCLYNIPGRTGVNIAPETVARIAKLKNVRAIKEGSGNIEQVTQIRALCSLKVLSGDDSLTWPILCLGGTGVISVAANIVPRAITEMCEAAAKGDSARARQLHDRHYELFKALFIETNPIPIKTAMKMMGMIGGDLRLPLSEMSDSNAARLKATLRRYGLL